MRIPKAIQNLIESFERLPGIGPKTAQRLTFYLLHVPQGELDKFALSVQNLKKETVLCSVCFTIGERSPCDICQDERRDRSTICVVEEPLDVLALERSGKYNGMYHVLHGKIDPLNNIGPDEIYIKQLIDRISVGQRNGSAAQSNVPAKSDLVSISEVILATNPTMEGESTAMYIAKELGELKAQSAKLKAELKITRIGRGLPTGADLEYADQLTLQKAMEGRSEY
jgi:recombination protein RecR